MDLQYKIQGLNDKGVLDVIYWHETDALDTYRIGIELPLVNGNYPEGDALTALIIQYAPTALFARKVALKTVGNAAAIHALANKQQSITVDPNTANTNRNRPTPSVL